MIRLSFEGWVSQSRPYSFKTHHEQHQIHRRSRFAGAGHLGDQVGGRVAPRTRDVSLDIESGELVALFGPSGCGLFERFLRCPWQFLSSNQFDTYYWYASYSLSTQSGHSISFKSIYMPKKHKQTTNDSFEF